MVGRQVLLLPALLAGLSGCCHSWCGSRQGPCSPPARPPVFVPARPVPVVPGPVPTVLPPTTTQGYPPGVVQDPTWQPSQPSAPSVRLQAPETDPDAPPVRLNPPETKEPPSVKGPPTVKEDDGTTLDIPQFAVARSKVANGLKPFADGIAWLKARGYRTVLQIRAPGEDDTAARRLFEKEGLRYESIEVSPKTLTRDLVDRFNKLVTDDARLPLFVYDRDGSLAGALWYLHYRIAVGMDDDKARDEAARLGFKPETEEHRTMLLAAKALLTQ
jgi:protein tyrosine phosphatase (PTP) superfamily phosphohydrolase (DUF442 family)